MTNRWIYPEHIQIETICGVCSARCIMCTINSWKRPPRVMDLDRYSQLLQRLQGNVRQKFLTLHGLGEPLLDKDIAQKVYLAKMAGFSGIGFASNCTELTKEKAKELLDAGLDTLICSVDGVSKETHEAIRIGTNFEEVRDNVECFISERNASGVTTKIMLRLIRQKSNELEWGAYKEYWEQRLDPSKGDAVLRFDVHNWGEDEKLTTVKHTGSVTFHERESFDANYLCSDLVDRLIIQASGKISFCCADDNDYFDLDDAFDKNPYAIYNSEPFVSYRSAMNKGRLHQLNPCKTCKIITSRQTRILPE